MTIFVHFAVWLSLMETLAGVRGKLDQIRLYLTKKLLPRLEDRRKYRQEFASSTSFHGVHKIVQTQSSTRRVLWLLVVTACLGIVIWQICSRFNYYFSWPTTTTVVVQHVENVKFPAVTFCNLNRFQAHAVSNLQIIFSLWNIVFGIVQTFSMEDKYFQELNGFLLGNQNFSIKEFTRENGFYLNGSTLLECEFFGKTCHPEDFEHIFTEYGNCFTFNHNDLPARSVSLSGRGLHLLFDVQQKQFTDDPALGYTDAGITFVIHSPKEMPRFDGLGLLTPVGTHAQVAIQQLKSIIQEYPWGECKPDIKLQYQDIYTTNGCLQECKAWYIQDWCGCSPFILPGNGIECDLMKSYNCVYPAIHDIEVKGLCTVGTHNSTCPAPCEETHYPTTVTYSSFGGENAIKYISAKLKKSPEYIRKNLVTIDIKYDDLSYRITQQQKALTIPELLADVGGQLGLFCGASMITLIELLEYIFTNFFWMCLFLLLKAPEIPQWNNPPHDQPTHVEKKRRIQEC
ncbi:acid-sensing ion channel 5 isoform X1 [Centrocercus urophasianus]|uniref:acid-sensing ion channel 5 isoform X1 n=1 Tax=Centrocercus urophasianus TaxID=9002 RepID=UPI001C64B816|nr:acid-sensing ion channel 5 isoform X1 [Centrocercus urophasianus]